MSLVCEWKQTETLLHVCEQVVKWFQKDKNVSAARRLSQTWGTICNPEDQNDAQRIHQSLEAVHGLPDY